MSTQLKSPQKVTYGTGNVSYNGTLPTPGSPKQVTFWSDSEHLNQVNTCLPGGTVITITLSDNKKINNITVQKEGWITPPKNTLPKLASSFDISVLN